jgi:hypothetical protein
MQQQPLSTSQRQGHDPWLCRLRVQIQVRCVVGGTFRRATDQGTQLAVKIARRAIISRRREKLCLARGIGKGKKVVCIICRLDVAVHLQFFMDIPSTDTCGL